MHPPPPDARYVELYNVDCVAIDLSDFSLQRFTNDNINPEPAVALSGMIMPQGFAIFARSAVFETLFQIAPTAILDVDGGPTDSNGNDVIQLLFNGTTVVDTFGVPGADSEGAAPFDFEVRRRGGRIDKPMH